MHVTDFRRRVDHNSSPGLQNGWSVKDYCVVATDVKQKEDCGKSSHWDPESSLLDCLPEGNLLAVALLDTLLDLLQLHLHSWVPGQWEDLDKWMLHKWKPRLLERHFKKIGLKLGRTLVCKSTRNIDDDFKRRTYFKQFLIVT